LFDVADYIVQQQQQKQIKFSRKYW